MDLKTLSLSATSNDLNTFNNIKKKPAKTSNTYNWSFHRPSILNWKESVSEMVDKTNLYKNLQQITEIA